MPSPTRRVAERMIVERTERARRIARELRSIAAQLEAHRDDTGAPDFLNANAARLRATADQVERL